MTPAERWGGALALVIKEKGWSVQGTADRIGEQRKTLDHWVHGRSFPVFSTAIRVAESLDRPHLAKLALELRTRSCVGCTRTFVAHGRYSKSIYCSQKCIKMVHARKRRAAEDGRERVAGVRLRLYMDTIDAYCRECEPEGVCRDAACKIQASGLSPFRLDRRTA